jgi:hypothetical protein
MWCMLCIPIDQGGEITDDITDPCKLKYQVQMPEWKKCSAESIESDGVYLLDDGELLWLYFGRYLIACAVITLPPL